MRKLRSILLISGIVLLHSSFCFADTSSFKPNWAIGDRWEIKYYMRDSSHLERAMELPERRLGGFELPRKFVFEVIGKVTKRGESCYEVEVPIWDTKFFIYFRASDLKVILVEEVDKTRRVISDENYSNEELVLTEMVLSHNFPFYWPDFNNLDPNTSPQMINGVKQEIKVEGDTLTVTWDNYVTQVWQKGDKWWSKCWTEGNDGEGGEGGQWNVITKAELISDITALINIEPDTLNMKSQGKYITCYIELPREYRPEDIDISAILLNDVVACEPSPTSYPDSDKNEIRELMVKFDREEVMALLSGETEEILVVTGRLKSGQSFKGEEKIKVVEKRPRLKGWIRSCQWSDRGKGIVCLDLSFEPKGKEKIKNIVVKEIEMSKGVSFDPKLSPALPYEIREISPMYIISQKPSFKIEPGTKKIGFVVKGTCQDENGRIFDFKFGKRFRIEKIKDFQEDIVQE